MSQRLKIARLPLYYHIFLLYIEPLSALLGAYYAYFHPYLYLFLTHAASAPQSSSSSTPSSPISSVLAIASVPLATRVALAQLANLYLLFAINEGLVLRATRDVRVWKTLLFGLLVADLGHLWSVRALATDASDSLLGTGAAALEAGIVGKVAENTPDWLKEQATGLLTGLMGGGTGGEWAAVYWKFWEWNAIAWGNVGFVYVGALTRVCFLLGIGFDDRSFEVAGSGRAGSKKSAKAA